MASITKDFKFLKRSIHATYILSFLGDISIGLFSFTLSIFTTHLADHLGMSPQEKGFWLGFVAMGWGSAYWLSPVLLGHASDKLGRKRSIILSMIGFSLINILILFSTHPIYLYLGFVMTAVCFGFYFPVLGALISETSQKLGNVAHSRALSNFMIAWSIGLTTGPFIGGFIIARLSFTLTFLILISFAVFIIIVTLTWIPSRPDLKKLLDDVEILMDEKEGKTKKENENENENEIFNLT
ncbi:MAG: MFS transporter [Promethearchaeota archaeon]